MNRAKWVFFVLFTSIPAAAQFFTAKIGGGFTEPEYNTGRRLNRGWNFGAGAGVNVMPYLGVLLDFDYNQFNINDATLTALQFPGGDMKVWDFSIDPIIRLNPHGRVGFYITGGGGVYHRTVEFTAPTVATFTAFDPFFGLFYPVAVPASQVLASESTVKGGVNGGAGFQFAVSGRLKFFAEARYHNIYTYPRATTYVPVTFGLRW